MSGHVPVRATLLSAVPTPAGAGKGLALAAYGIACVGGYLGGHLIEVRKVASHHPGFRDETGGPRDETARAT